MAGHVHHVVDAAEQPEVAVLVDAGAVTSKVRVRVLRPVRLPVALVVAVDPAQHRRPRPPQHEVAAASGRDLVPLLVVDGGVHPGERLRRRTRLQRRHPRQRRDQDHPRLRLPPRVDDRHAAGSDHLAVPDPGLRVDRLTDRAKEPDRRQVVLLRMLRPPLHVRADRGRRRVQDVDAVALDDRPPTVAIRIVRHALVHDPGRPVAQGPVDDVAVARHPADVGGAPVHRVGLDVEDVVVRRRHADEVAGGRVRDPLRLRRRPARVEQVEQILRVHRLARTGCGVVILVVDQLVPPLVAPLLHRHLVAGPAQDDGVLHSRRLGQRLVGVPLQRHG